MFSEDYNLTLGRCQVSGEWVGLDDEQRARHAYVIGQTGSGKTTLMVNMVVQDILSGRGVTIIDPHGDAARRIADAIPSYRMKDVVFFDTSDAAHPLGFNPLHKVAEPYRSSMVESLVECFKSQWEHSWGPRMAYVLRNCLQTLICQPVEMHCKLLSVSRMLTERPYRQRLIRNVRDPVLRRYWDKEFDAIPEREIANVISPILNKLGAYSQHRELRNIIGQARSSLCLSDIINGQKILIVNLSKARLGEEGSAMLGALFVSGLQQAAYARDEMDEADRIPHGLFIDEFQSLTSANVLCSIYSEARKYGLNLCTFNQYTDQLEPKLLKAIFGNVGTIAAFAVGLQDAERLAAAFDDLNPSVLSSASRGQFVVQTRRGGSLLSPIFVAGEVMDWSLGSLPKSRHITHNIYGRNRTRRDVERRIERWYL